MNEARGAGAKAITALRVVQIALFAAAAVLSALAIAAAALGGVTVRSGPIRFSATSPARLFVEAAVALALGWTARRSATTTAHTVSTAGVVAALLLAVAMESSPRLVGDGREYLLMARQFALLRPPALSPPELVEGKAALAQFAGYGPVREASPEFLGADGRGDFVHFWLYSLAAAPFVMAATALGVHPNFGFVALHLVLLVAAACALVRYCGSAAVVLLICGPAIWWIDKAHSELFTFSLLLVAAALIQRAPAAALAAAGAAAAQSPPLAVVVVSFAAAALWMHGRRAVIGVLLAGSFVALHTLYYAWHLRRLSPLATKAVWGMPNTSSYLAPVLDPNIGILWHFPALLVLLICIAIASVRDRPRVRFFEWTMAIAGAMLLFLLAQTANVNHGATPGPSRYGLWVAALMLPMVSRAATSKHLRDFVPLLAGASLVYSVWAYHPKLPDRSVEPTTLAAWLWRHAPSLYNPLPEIFIERVGGVDGWEYVPVATARCEKVLLVGEGSPRARWPIPCGPHGVPEMCLKAGSLCYATRNAHDTYDFVRAPRQIGFEYRVTPESSWQGREDFAWLPLRPAWDAMERVRPFSGRSWLRDVTNAHPVKVLQADSQFVAWFYVKPPLAGRVLVRIESGGDIWVADPIGRQIITGRRAEPGLTWIDVPTGTTMVFAQGAGRL